MSNTLEPRLQQALTDARKARDRDGVALFGMTLSELANRRIELGRTPTEGEAEAVIVSARKRRLEAAEQMRAGGRELLAEKEEAEARILASFLPEGLSEEEVRAIIRGAIDQGITEIGPLMGILMPRIRGRFDGKEANRIAREVLGQG
jgi:uncharacterized protein YqeY